MKPDEEERAGMAARNNPSDAELVARLNAVPDTGGKLIVELSDFMALRTKDAKLNLATESPVPAAQAKAWRAMASTCMQEARYEGLSIRGRADAAFDAVYFYAMCLVGPNVLARQHPHVDILLNAADRLCWPQEAMRAAVNYLPERDEPLRDGRRFDGLMTLALRLKDAINLDGDPAESHT